MSNTVIQFNTDYYEITNCVACGSEKLIAVLDLGNQPLANNLLDDSHKNVEKFPLVLNACLECFHSQLSIAVSPYKLFTHYLYESGTSTTLSEYFNYFVEKYINSIGSGLKVIDIASNDGTFLKYVKLHGHSTLGIDPAANLLPAALQNRVETICAFWPGEDISSFIKPVDVVIAMNVLAHVSNPAEFLIACKNTISDDGVIYVQTSQAKMIELGQFDTMYHEHISFFNVRSMKALASRVGLSLINVSYEDIHGTSYVWELRKNTHNKALLTNEVEKHEHEINLYSIEILQEFSEKARGIVEKTRNFVNRVDKSKYKIVGYGVAAKGNTFIHFSSLDINFMVDDNSWKQGKFTPGTNIEILKPDVIAQIDQPICFIIPAWNFVNEIVEVIKSYRMNDFASEDLVVTYFPKFEVRNMADFK